MNAAGAFALTPTLPLIFTATPFDPDTTIWSPSVFTRRPFEPEPEPIAGAGAGAGGGAGGLSLWQATKATSSRQCFMTRCYR